MNDSFKKIIVYVLSFLFVGVLGIAIYSYFTIPDTSVIENYRPLTPSIIYDTHGVEIDTVTFENRDPVSIEEIPENVQNAFLAIEDRKFRSHYGFDVLRLIKAIFLNVTRLGQEGGSSITQQLAKNAFLSPERTLTRKFKELFLAIKIEQTYSKDEILEKYLNTIYFGSSVYGIKNASLRYFNKVPSELTTAEAAVLASIPKSPTNYSPIENYDNSIKRHNVVLKQMEKFDFITKEEYEKAIKQKIVIYNSKTSDEEEKLTLTSRAPEFSTVAIEEAKKILGIKDDGTDIKILFDGYKIYTTVDLEMQKAAYRAVKDNYNIKNRAELEGALISMDPSNGYVRAMVGGKNFKKGDFNRALSAQVQPGSSFKPFIYFTALQNGIPMNTVIEDSPFQVGSWAPKNYDGKFNENLTLMRALEISNNIVSIKLLDNIGTDKVKANWFSTGVKSKDFPETLSLALGSITTTPVDMAIAYSAFANGGYKVEPVFIEKIENKFGEVIYESDKTEVPVKIFETEDTALITHMMSNVINFGTGKPAQIVKGGKVIDQAGKTGTTNDNVTAWFTGYTPDLTTIVYVGNDDNKPMGSSMTGSRAAAPIWKEFMQAVVNLEGFSPRSFEFISENLLNKDLTYTTVDFKLGLIDNDGTNARRGLFKRGTEPIEDENKFRQGLDKFF